MLHIFQIERLCVVVYLDVLISSKNPTNLSGLMEYMLYEGFDAEETLPALMTRAEWEVVARDIIADKALGGLFVVKYENDEKTGHRAVCFSSGNGEAYVVFRGTYSDSEWLDNGLGILLTETPAQRNALGFVNAVRKDFPETHYLCVAGHSKGGNKAQYCAVVGQGSVDCCVSVDGQGFSRSFFEKYSDITHETCSKINAIAERRDFVNCLGFYLKQPDYYSGGRGTKTEEQPFGEPLHFFHCPDALRSDTSMGSVIGEPVPVSYTSQVFNSFTVYYLTEEKYKKKREDTVLGLVSLMTESRGGKKAVIAVVEAALAFFELTAKSEDFRAKLRNLFLHEHDMVAATARMIRRNYKDSGDAAEKAMKLFAERIFRNPFHFRHFIKSAEKFVMFRKKYSKHKKQLNHIQYFIKIIFRNMEKLKSKKLT